MTPQRRWRTMKQAVRWAWCSLSARPAHLLVAGSALVIILALGVWSCQTSPARPRAPIETTPARAVAVYLGHEPDIRVRIRQGIVSAKIAGEGLIQVRALGDGPEPRRLPLPISITLLERGLRITDGREAPWSYPASVELSPEPGQILRIESNRYAGRVRLVPRVPDADPGAAPPAASRAGTHFDIVEILPLESYIAGVTVSELFSHWSLGAYHIQSICARTYALQQRQRAQAMGRDFDLEATVIDQAYNGFTEHAVARQAALETRGIVLTWQGRLLRAYYSSTCGGRTAGAAEIWPTGPGFEFNLDAPIQATDRDHACQNSTSYTWEVSRSIPELTARMRRWGESSGHRIKNMTAFQSAQVTQRNSTGRPVMYEVTDNKGRQYNLGAEHLRNACNHAAPGFPDITMKTRVRSGDATLEPAAGIVTIRGRGFGHGVGMCQYCAQGMAQRGDSWRDMLRRFYPGASIERLY